MKTKLYLEMVTLAGQYREKVKVTMGEISKIDRELEKVDTTSKLWQKALQNKAFAVQEKIYYETFITDLENAIERGME